MKTYRQIEDEASTSILEALSKLGELSEAVKYQRSLVAQVAHAFGAIELTAEDQAAVQGGKLASIADVLQRAKVAEKVNGKA